MKTSEIKKFLVKNIVTIIFVIMSILGLMVSQQPMFFIVNELVQRFSRNSFLVMALIIPVMAGLGLNFSIVIGAMAGQMALIMVTDWSIGGLPGIFLAMLISVPLAYIFGMLIGILLNKTRGQEMIASMIVGFFANGLYQFIYLFLAGNVIPFNRPELLISGGVGVRNTVDLSKMVDGVETGVKYAFDKANLFGIDTSMRFFESMAIIFGLYLAYRIYKHLKPSKAEEVNKKKEMFFTGVSVLLFALSLYGAFGSNLPKDIALVANIKVPMFTLFLVFIGGLINILITKTKMGQDFRTVGQDQHVATVSGIDVDKTRVRAMKLSTILAAFGQIIILQNMGVLNTFGSHMQVGMYSIAAILVGGASISRATVGQALLGVLLFHTLFAISPYAGKALFGDSQIGEFFRVFITYSVISLSLGLYAWKKVKADQERQRNL